MSTPWLCPRYDARRYLKYLSDTNISYVIINSFKCKQYNVMYYLIWNNKSITCNHDTLNIVVSWKCPNMYTGVSTVIILDSYFGFLLLLHDPLKVDNGICCQNTYSNVQQANSHKNYLSSIVSLMKQQTSLYYILFVCSVIWEIFLCRMIIW